MGTCMRFKGRSRVTTPSTIHSDNTTDSDNTTVYALPPTPPPPPQFHHKLRYIVLHCKRGVKGVPTLCNHYCIMRV